MESWNPTATDPFKELVRALQAALSPVPNPSSASSSPMALPATYSGEVVECSVYLLQLSLVIEMQPQRYVSEQLKVAFLISLLSGRVLLWAWAIWNSQSSLVNSFDAYSAPFKEVNRLSIHGQPTHSPQTRHFFGERLHPSVPNPEEEMFLNRGVAIYRYWW